MIAGELGGQQVIAGELGGQQVIAGEPSRRNCQNRCESAAKVAKMPIVLTKTVQKEYRMLDVQGDTKKAAK